jgi:hypothetical protein
MCAVMGAIALITMLATAMLVGVMKIRQGSSGAYHRFLTQSAAADQFRMDVGRAEALASQFGTRASGPECLILRMPEGRHIVYDWRDGRLERSEVDGTRQSSAKVPVGGERVRAEFARSGGDHPMAVLRLIEKLANGHVHRQFDIAASVGGDRR